MKTYKFKIGGNDYEVEIGKIEGKTADVTVNGVSYQVEMENAPAAPAAPVAAAPVAAAAPAASPFKSSIMHSAAELIGAVSAIPTMTATTMPMGRGVSSVAVFMTPPRSVMKFWM